MDSLYYTLLFVWIWQYQPHFPHFPRNLFFDGIAISHFMWALHLRGWPWVGWGGVGAGSKKWFHVGGGGGGGGRLAPGLTYWPFIWYPTCIAFNLIYLISYGLGAMRFVKEKSPTQFLRQNNCDKNRVICDIWKRGGGLQSLLQYFSFELTIGGYNSFSALNR